MEAVTKRTREKKKSRNSNLIEMELFKCDHSNEILVQIGPNEVNVNGAVNNSIKRLNLGTFVDLSS